MGTIYILENKTNNKCYIGQTSRTFSSRLNSHLRKNSPLGNALQKYGIENFNTILLEDIPEEQLDDLEREHIIKYNSLYPNGYNLETGGHKYKHSSEETKKKISEVKKGNTYWVGRHHTEETKRKISETNKGKILTEETKKKISETTKGENNHFFGKHHTEESKKKNKESHKEQVPWNKGKIDCYTEEVRKKMSESRKGIPSGTKGRHRTEEQRKNNSESHKEQVPWNKDIPMTEEQKQKISKAKSNPSQETRKRLSESHKGQIPWNKGK